MPPEQALAGGSRRQHHGRARATCRPRPCVGAVGGGARAGRTSGSFMQVSGLSASDLQCCRVQNQLNRRARYTGMKKMLAFSGSRCRRVLLSRYSCSVMSTARRRRAPSATAACVPDSTPHPVFRQAVCRQAVCRQAVCRQAARVARRAAGRCGQATALRRGGGRTVVLVRVPAGGQGLEGLVVLRGQLVDVDEGLQVHIGRQRPLRHLGRAPPPREVLRPAARARGRLRRCRERRVPSISSAAQQGRTRSQRRPRRSAIAWLSLLSGCARAPPRPATAAAPARTGRPGGQPRGCAGACSRPSPQSCSS